MSRMLIGLEGPRLTDRERDWLGRSDVAGVVLFTRNATDLDSLRALTDAIRERREDALIAIDQEGGRVQRIGSPCTRLPALGRIGHHWPDDPDDALYLAFRHAWLMAREMLALGIDLSFAPVLDLDRGSPVIGDRAFHPDAEVVKELGRAYVKGMHQAGMAATGKHFPGHGWVAADTHDAVAVDPRELDEIAGEDLRPYSVALRNGLDAVMMAHVVYPRVCPNPAGYSPVWCREILRERMGFEGVIFSDDLGMRAAAEVGDFGQRFQHSLEAGCDLALVCRPADVARAMAEIEERDDPPDHSHRSLLARRQPSWQELTECPEREFAQIALQSMEE